MKLLLPIVCAALLCGCDQAPPSAPPAPVRPLNGKDFSGWKFEGRVKRNFWKIGTAEVDPANAKTLIVKDGGAEAVSAGIVGADLRTEQEFGDALIELEFMVPPGSNSGVFVMGEYELQILDDPKVDPAKPGNMDQGALVRTVAPRVLAAGTPGQWQTYRIDYQAPRFDAAGNKTRNARLLSVAVNGQVVHENLDVPGPTPGGLTGKESPRGPLVLQGSEGPVAFRNVVITPRN
jgi:hypothetical protein